MPNVPTGRTSEETDEAKWTVGIKNQWRNQMNREQEDPAQATGKWKPQIFEPTESQEPMKPQEPQEPQEPAEYEEST